ncbi:FkbM family methyltransferase [Pseudomonas guariconensis]|uniref:FkbM family methyltransferase n=1 Tax=Pseudomonas guariconensis TaxID=1288410 RepID=UPI0025A95591|nr:FkbM family methyltransferase [Pseudomonas guariconensis]MDM9593140.1 FkbM family methyltransferase [Pseudomonas guariconensis]MDM9605967.1 FkbM family methyltransferase [Pseudomonas guariconensis]MDM9610924.1 FkbM family methyltransferase [Pseudomonas guariconensis]
MNTLTQIRAAHEAGETAKQVYIESVHARHASLFDYPEFIAGTDVEALRIQPDGVFVRSRSQQIELFLDPRDQHLVPCTLMNFRAYETVETEFLKRITQEHALILDIGANCGWYALALAKHRPSARIHAFEPIPYTFEILERNIRHNGLPNIEAHRLAFSNHEATLEFLYTPHCSGATSSALAGQPGSQENLQKIACPATTLDLFCAQRGLAPQIIKCDVEGAELMVIQGGGATLAEHKPVILIELLRKWSRQFGYHPNDVVELLGREGYQAYTLSEEGLRRCPGIDEDTRETNFVFMHEQQHRNLLNLVHS